MFDASEIIAFRKRNGLSQAALAEKLGVNQATVSRIESGEEPSKPVARLLEFVMAEESAENASPTGEAA